MHARTVAKITRLYPLLSGCGTLANHRFVDVLADRSEGEVWAEVEGGKLSVDLNDYVGRAAYFVGDPDRKISAVIDRFVKPGDTVLDIGANIGIVSLRLAKRVGSSGIVHAFEPNPIIADRFEKSLRVSNVGNVKLHRIALGAATGSAQLHVPDRNAGMASLIDAKSANTQTFDITVRRLDDLHIGPIDFIKMDVEGFEADVLRGFSRALEDQPPKIILFEQNDDSGESIDILNNVGYQVFGIAKSLIKLKLIKTYRWSPQFHDYVAVKDQTHVHPHSSDNLASA